MYLNILWGLSGSQPVFNTFLSTADSERLGTDVHDVYCSAWRLVNWKISYVEYPKSSIHQWQRMKTIGVWVRSNYSTLGEHSLSKPKSWCWTKLQHKWMYTQVGWFKKGCRSLSQISQLLVLRIVFQLLWIATKCSCWMLVSIQFPNFNLHAGVLQQSWDYVHVNPLMFMLIFFFVLYKPKMKLTPLPERRCTPHFLFATFWVSLGNQAMQTWLCSAYGDLIGLYPQRSILSPSPCTLSWS